MTNMLQNSLIEKIREINGDKLRMEAVKAWIDGGYYGKIISFSTPERGYHIVFMKECVEAREGEYPSAEVTYRGSEGNIIKILKRESTANKSVKSGEMSVWGSVNEAIRFEALL